MARRLIVIGVLATMIAAVAHVFAFSTSYPAPDEAAEAGLANVLGNGWTISGSCEHFPREVGAGDVCYARTEAGDGSFEVYRAAPGIPDFGWWIGVQRLEGGWTAYDGGRCNMVYCRRTVPGGMVIDGWGWPNGDANGDGTVDSLDALHVLQLVAQAVDDSEPPFSLNGDVDGSGLDSHDAFHILQAHARLTGGLPLRQPWAPDFGEK